MGFKKRGQITAFVIMGLVLAISVALLYYVINQQQRTIMTSQVEEQFDATIQLDFVEPYVQECMRQVAKKAVRSIAYSGGTFDPVEYINHNNSKVNLLCIDQFQPSCVNTMLVRQSIKKDLEIAMGREIQNCLDFSIFEKKGYEITEGSTKIDVNIGERAVIIKMDHPVTFIRQNREVSFETFSASLDIPLGEVYDLAVNILNSEIDQGYFDQDEFMLAHPDFRIEKFRPYPYIIYSVKKAGLEFRFALQGKVSAGTSMKKPGATLGSCINPFDGLCFNNVPAQACSFRLGIHRIFSCGLPVGFNVITDNVAQCENGLCNDCGSTWEYFTQDFTGPARKHGESWCVYDGPVGPGFSYVGSRHYKHTCIDGTEHVESCRDYREELCTAEDIERATGEYEKAVCRVNRWQSCRFCQSKECCEDLDKRDCYWSDWLVTEGKCIPYIPPGFKFWEGSGADVCLYANQKKECEGFSCPNNWVDSSAFYCLFQGDCGNFRNIADEVTKEGFFETDAFDKVRDYVYLSDGRTTREGLNGRLDLGIGNRDFDETKIDEFALSLDRFSAQVASMMDFLDEASRFNFADFVNPFIDKPSFKITDFTFCSLWQPPLGSSQCGFCNGFKNKPCTEYRCKSLGQNCEFEMINGSFPNCFEVYGDDDQPPVIEINTEAITPPYTPVPSSMESYSGYEIRPKLVPHLPFVLGIKTDEPTRCKLDFTPFFDYAALPSYWFGDESFSTTHNLSIRIPPELKIPESLLAIFNITTEGDISRILSDPERVFEKYEEEFKDINDLYEQQTGKDVIAKIKPYVTNAIGLIKVFSPQLIAVIEKILKQMYGGGYYIFVHCVDKAGNENDQEFFIKVDINRTAQDTYPPYILRTFPANMTLISYAVNEVELTLYMNEPSVCRFSNESEDYSNMTGTFDCVTSPYDIVPIAGGSYECIGKIPTVDSGAQVFIRCADNPSEFEEYHASFIPSNKMEIIGTPSRFYNITGPGKIEVAGSIAKRGIDIRVNTSAVRLDLYLNEERFCRFSNAGSDFEDMTGLFSECELSQRLELGNYRCSALVDVSRYSLSTDTSKDLGNYTLNIALSNKSEVVVNDSGVIRSRLSSINLNFTKGVLRGNDTLNFNLSMAGVTLTVNQTAECRWTSKLNDSYENMTQLACAQQGNMTLCQAIFPIISNTSIKFICRNKTEEVKNDSQKEGK